MTSPRTQDPAILVTCVSTTGHMIPMLQIVTHLCSRGYDIWFAASAHYRSAVERSGARFVEAGGPFGQMFDLPSLPTSSPSQDPMDIGDFPWERFSTLYKDVWLSTIPSSLETIRRGMTVVRDTNPDRDVVIIAETLVSGIVPLKMGAWLPEGYPTVPKSLGISVIPPLWTSIDQGPTVFGFPHEDNELGRIRNVMAAELLRMALKNDQELEKFIFRSCGITQDVHSFFKDYDTGIYHQPLEASYLCHATTLQMCIPSLEYKHTDWPKHVKFGGTLPPKPHDPDFVFPKWFDTIKENSAKLTGGKESRKKVVVTVQGTKALEYQACIVPTVKGLAGREDIIVVALLGVKGATLDSVMNCPLPANAIIADYIPYDALLEHADVVVTNGSYGIFGHCASQGVPMVVGGGYSEDKPEVSRRVEYVGLGVDLHDAHPTPEVLSSGVDRVLANEKYKLRAMELQKEVQEFAALDVVERELRALF